MYQALVFHGIVCCVAHFRFRANDEQIQIFKQRDCKNFYMNINIESTTALILSLCLTFIICGILYVENQTRREIFIQILVIGLLICIIVCLMEVLDKLVWKGKYQTLKTITNFLITTVFAFIYGYRQHGWKK
jgi:uncharacterized membrane protein